jgi:hypothetical protein
MAVLKSAASMPAASNALLRDYASSRIRRGTLWVGLSVIACAIDLGLRLEPTGGIDVIRLIEDSLEGLGDDSGDPVIGLALIFSVTGFLQAIYAVRHSSRLRRLIQQGRPARRMLIQTGTVHTDDKNIDEPDEPYAAAYLRGPRATSLIPGVAMRRPAAPCSSTPRASRGGAAVPRPALGRRP